MNMNNDNKIFITKALRYDNMLFFFPHDAIDIINYCLKNKIIVNGIDAFIISGKGIQPSMENSLWLKDMPDNYSKYIEFLSDPAHEHYVYEIWYDGY